VIIASEDTAQTADQVLDDHGARAWILKMIRAGTRPSAGDMQTLRMSAQSPDFAEWMDEQVIAAFGPSDGPLLE
jgi:hypothetical protein